MIYSVLSIDEKLYNWSYTSTYTSGWNDDDTSIKEFDDTLMNNESFTLFYVNQYAERINESETRQGTDRKNSTYHSSWEHVELFIQKIEN